MSEYIRVEVKCSFDDCNNTTAMRYPVDRTVRPRRCKACKDRKTGRKWRRFTHTNMEQSWMDLPSEPNDKE